MLIVRSTSFLLAKFISNLIKELKSVSNDKLESNFLRVTVKKLIGEMSLKEKIYEKDLDLQENCLKKRLQYFQSQKDEVTQYYEKKGKRRVNYFLAFLTAQIALIQYGTYVAFSWDIIEPITCLLGVIDLIIAYRFWLKTEKDYSFEEMKNHYVLRKMDYFLKSKDFDVVLPKMNDFMKSKNFDDVLLKKPKLKLEEEIQLREKLLKITYLEKEIFKANWENLREFFGLEKKIEE